jgi:hypothetical protein
MNCRRAWDMEFLHSHFSKAFVGGRFKKHRETVLLEREKSRLPETMPYVEKKLFIQRVIEWVDTTERWLFAHDYPPRVPANNTALDYLQSARSLHITQLSHSIRFSRRYVAELLRNPDMLHDETVDYRFERFDLIFDRNSAVHIGAAAASAAAEAKDRKRFVRACTADGCRGFLSTAWKCGLCECRTCPTCHEFIGKITSNSADPPHACKPENVETARMLNHDSRPCPICASLIFKISGCDQMFCTQCNTAFDWKTGRSLNMRNVHNPHYFEFMRRQRERTESAAAAEVVPDEEEDPTCREMPSLNRITDRERELQTAFANENPQFGIDLLCQVMFNKDGKAADDELTTFCKSRNIHEPYRLMSSIVRLYNHINHVTLRYYIPANHEQNRDLRIKYILKEITDEKFKLTLHSREKRENIKNETRLVLEMFANSCIDLVNRMVASPNETYAGLCHEFVALYDYSRGCLRTIAKRYNVVESTIELNGF